MSCWRLISSGIAEYPFILRRFVQYLRVPVRATGSPILAGPVCISYGCSYRATATTRYRRVLQRMRRDSLCMGSECTSAIERYVWSGDQLLYEIRAPGGNNATAAQLESDVPSGDEYGRVDYGRLRTVRGESMNPFSAVAGLLVVGFACGSASGAKQSVSAGPTISAITLLAESSERPAGLVPVERVWSPYDYRDSIVVRVQISPDSTPSGQGPGYLVVDVQVAVSPVVWADNTEEVADLDRMRAQAFWLPAVAASELDIARARTLADGRLEADVAVVSPGRIAERLGIHSPGMEPVRLRVRGYLVAPGATTTAGSRWAEKTIDLNPVE